MVSKLLKNNSYFSQVNLSKNDFSADGLRLIADVLKDHNQTVIHLNLGGNHLSTESITNLFQALTNHPSLVSINLANNDCYKNKIKISHRSAEALRDLLTAPQCLLTHLNLTDNALTSESLIAILEGAAHC